MWADLADRVASFASFVDCPKSGGMLRVGGTELVREADDPVYQTYRGATYREQVRTHRDLWIALKHRISHRGGGIGGGLRRQLLQSHL